jgi:poly-gamma-glutamate capsule biosynthesis protein CapA/YwtB (metallophosphatase superfamily)
LHKHIRYHMHVDNLEPVMRGFAQVTHQHGSSSESSTTTSSPLIVSYANNHCMDYGRRAFETETLPALASASSSSLFQAVGCGRNIAEAYQPVRIRVGTAHNNDNGATGAGMSTILEVFAFSTGCSGTPLDWWAQEHTSGIAGLPALYDMPSVERALEIVKMALKEAGSSKNKKESSPLVVRVVSIHWGPNWARKGESNQEVDARREFAHRLIDECGVDLIYGHSSHHVRGMELYRSKLILYGTGDMINDYEGFENQGEEQYNKLGGLFLVDMDAETGDFCHLKIVPMFMNRLRLERYNKASLLWKPNERILQSDPSKSQDFCRFLNELSQFDAGRSGQALELVHVESDPEIPGGPVLQAKYI